MNVHDYNRGVTPLSGVESAFAKTASGGISARSGTQCGISEDVLLCYVGTDGSILETTTKLIVINPFGSDVGGDTYITVKRVGGNWIVDAEDCPA